MKPTIRRAAFAALLFALAGPLLAQEAVIRKTLAERLPKLPPIDEVTRTPIPGLWEVRMGTDLVYTDDKGEHLIVGASIIDTKTRVDLTEARMDKLTAIDFAKLPVGIAWGQTTLNPTVVAASKAITEPVWVKGEETPVDRLFAVPEHLRKAAPESVGTA